MLERDDADFEHVAGFGLVDIDRAGEHMGAAAARAVDLGADVERVLQNLFARDAMLGEELDRVFGKIDAAVGDRVDAHGLAGLDAQHRRDVGGEIAPHHGVGRRAHGMIGRGLERDGLRGGGRNEQDERCYGVRN